METDEHKLILGLEKTINLPSILEELNFAKKKVKRRYSSKLNILLKMIEVQTNLTAIYLHQCFIKKR